MKRFRLTQAPKWRKFSTIFPPASPTARLVLRHRNVNQRAMRFGSTYIPQAISVVVARGVEPIEQNFPFHHLFHKLHLLVLPAGCSRGTYLRGRRKLHRLQVEMDILYVQPTPKTLHCRFGICGERLLEWVPLNIISTCVIVRSLAPRKQNVSCVEIKTHYFSTH